MTFHPERYIGSACAALAVLAVAFPVADWWRVRNLPPAVLAAVDEWLPEAEPIGATWGFDGGRPVYRVRVRAGGVRYAVGVTPDGRVLHAVPLDPAWERSGG